MLGENSPMKLPRIFYLRALVLSIELFAIGGSFGYMLTDQIEFDELQGGEICREYETITGYCIKMEVIKFEKIDPILIFIFIMFLSFSTGINLKTMYVQYKKAKYGFKSTW